VDPSNDLSKDDREIVLGTTSDLIKTINYITGSALSDEDKWIALQATDTLAKTIDLIRGADLSTQDRTLALTSVSDLQKTIDLILGKDLTSETRNLALTATSTLAKTIDFALGEDVSADDRLIALETASELQKTIDFAVGSELSTSDRELVLLESAGITRNIQLLLNQSNLTADQRSMLMTALQDDASTLKRTVEALYLEGATGDALTRLRTALSGNSSFNRTAHAMLDDSSLAAWERAFLSQLVDTNANVKVDFQNDYFNDIQDAVAGGVIGVDSNTKGIASDAQKQLSELGLLRNEMELNTNGVIRLNSSMTSLTSAIMRLAQLQEDAAQAEIDRANQEAAALAAAEASRIATENRQRLDAILQKNVEGGNATFASAGLSPRAVLIGNYVLSSALLAKYKDIDAALLDIKRSGMHIYQVVNDGGDIATHTTSDAEIRRQLEWAYQPVQQQFNTYLQGLRDQIRALGGTPFFAEGGIHTGGMRIVGERGPELEMTGPSAIMSYNDLMQSLKSSGDVAAEIGSLRAEIRGLRQEARSTAVTNAEIARKINRIEREGLVVRPDPEEVEEAEVLAI
jgi:hypothetical protein